MREQVDRKPSALHEGGARGIVAHIATLRHDPAVAGHIDIARAVRLAVVRKHRVFERGKRVAPNDKDRTGVAGGIRIAGKRAVRHGQIHGSVVQAFHIHGAAAIAARIHDTVTCERRIGDNGIMRRIERDRAAAAARHRGHAVPGEIAFLDAQRTFHVDRAAILRSFAVHNRAGP